MSRDVYEEINFGELEYRFIYQCAPVLAGLKISNLLIVNRNQAPKALKLVRNFDLSAYLLYATLSRVVFLVFNKEKTIKYMEKDENIIFLKKLGYGETSLETVLSEISVKYAGYMEQISDFPDELGIVLGYPTEDVLGYVENGGKDFLLNGYWKVYGNADEKRNLFHRFDEVTEEMIRTFISVKNIKTVAALYGAA